MITIWNWLIGALAGLLLFIMFAAVVAVSVEGKYERERFTQACHKVGGTTVFNGRHHECIK